MYPAGEGMNFEQLILRKIIKIVATRCQILRLKCTEIDIFWGSAQDPTGCCSDTAQYARYGSNLVMVAFFFSGPGPGLARARAWPGPRLSRSFSRPSLARARAQPFFFAAPAGPGGPKLARPVGSAVIGHAHLPRFSCFANGVGKQCVR